MPVIDVQVHPFDRNHPGRPWANPSHGLCSATGEEMIAAMESLYKETADKHLMSVVGIVGKFFGGLSNKRSK